MQPLGIPENLAGRTRICDLGYLQQAYLDEQGRCPSEPVADYVRKGGKEEDTHRRACLCNGLMVNVSLPQTQKWGREERLFTAGDDLVRLPSALRSTRTIPPRRSPRHRPMHVPYLASVWLHILAAAAWIGGMVFLAFVAPTGEF